jgi:hypothetical protein
VEEYTLQFEELLYQIAIQNPHYDEQFYVSQFIKGLKQELRAAVESQVPETVERAILLALVQQEVLEKLNLGDNGLTNNKKLTKLLLVLTSFVSLSS